MADLTLVWLVLPLFVGFSIYLLPKAARHLALFIALCSAGYGLQQIVSPSSLTLLLIDSFGVSLSVDRLSGYFVLTNALVTAAVVLYCWSTQKTAYFFTQLIILHGCVNAVFVCADFMSLYVALEVIGISAFLLITYRRSDRTIWIGLRYLFISNTAMLLYLIGAVLVYQANSSFAFAGLRNAPTEAIALIMLGLLTKGGVFVSGLWLPLTHSEADTPVSAMLSGVVVKSGVFPLVRCALLMEEISPIVQFFGVATAILGTGAAILEQDTKRLLAWSTISQVGFVLVAPVVAGFYTLAHGLAKGTLFLTAGRLPSRQFDTLRQTSVGLSWWIVLAAASLSLSGFPLFAGFDAKIMTLKQLTGWQSIVMNGVAVGSAIAFAKFIFLPFTDGLAMATSQHNGKISEQSNIQANTQADTNRKKPTEDLGFWLAVTLLLGSLVAASALHAEDYTQANLLKALVTIAGGWIGYQVIFKRIRWSLPEGPEQLEHLIGSMSMVLILLFWRVMV
ncbi:MAG: cation:proton antiporter [Cyanobacteria bacterium J06623_5]